MTDEQLKLADELAEYKRTYSSEWVSASPTLSWTRLDLIIAALSVEEAVATDATCFWPKCDCCMSAPRDVAVSATKPITENQIKHMVDRFLGWKLPSNFCPDAGISFKANFNENTAYPMKHEPSGTNLFDATQTDGMVRHMIEGMTAEAIGREWHDISTAPKDGTKVDLWLDGCRATDCFWREDHWAWLDSWKPNKSGAKTRFVPVYKSYSDIEPSHWMPLPAGPSVTRPE